MKKLVERMSYARWTRCVDKDISEHSTFTSKSLGPGTTGIDEAQRCAPVCGCNVGHANCVVNVFLVYEHSCLTVRLAKRLKLNIIVKICPTARGCSTEQTRVMSFHAWPHGCLGAFFVRGHRKVESLHGSGASLSHV